MDHHTSWFSFFWGYQDLHHYLNTNESMLQTVWFNGGIMPAHRQFNTVHHIYAAALVALFLLVLSFIARGRLKSVEDALIPSPKLTITNVLELIMETVLGFMKDIIGTDYKRHVPLIGTLALYILFSNLLGLIPGFVPPTDNLNTTLAAGIVVFVWFNINGLRAEGIHHITHLANPVGTWWGWFLAPLMFPIEVIGLVVRPFSLGIRLAANMIGDHAVLFAFAAIFPLFLPLPFYILGTLVCLIQTTVFVLLSCVYISLHAPEDAHH